MEMESVEVTPTIQAQNTLMITKTTKQKEFMRMQKDGKQQPQVHEHMQKVIKHRYTRLTHTQKEGKLGLWPHKRM